MSADLRRETILERIARQGRVRIAELAADLSVSNETIRRDLCDLQAEGALRRVHGGAIPPPQDTDTPISERMRQNARGKDYIAQQARMLIKDGTSIFLDTGTTTLALARRLGGLHGVRLWTNSLLVARAACTHPGIRVQMTPGLLRPVEQDLVGHDTIAYIRQFRFDIAFMGVASIDAGAGFLDIEEDEAHIRQALLDLAEQCIVLADSTKFGRRGNVLSAPFSRVNQLITDRPPPEGFLAAARTAGIQVRHG